MGRSRTPFPACMTPVAAELHMFKRLMRRLPHKAGSQMATRKSHSHSHSADKGKRKIHKVMKEHKEGTLKSGSGKKVKSRKQAVAIALSEARRSGAKIPNKKKKS